MLKTIPIFLILFFSGCATVGPVTVNPDDTIVTVLSALAIAVIVLFIKAFIEYQFAKRLEKYKKNLK